MSSGDDLPEFDVTDSLISLIGSKTIGLETVALAAELIAANARFNHRVLSFKDNPQTANDDLFDLIEFSANVSGSLAEHLVLFRRDPDVSRLNAKLAEISSQLNARL